MKSFCPISYKRVDENIIRINSFISLSLAIAALFVDNESALYITAFLIVDFSTRGFVDSKYSLISNVGKAIGKSLRLNANLINAGPKIFAAQVGMIFSLGIFIGFYFHIPMISYVSGVTLIICAFLEAVSGFCVACKIYPLIRSVQLTSFDSSKL